MENVKRLRDTNYKDYGISEERLKELRAFCRQYEEKKSKIKYGTSSSLSDGMPKGSSQGSPTERQAIENVKYKNDCRIIEESAIRANPGIWKYILRSVTEGLAFEFIEYDDELGRLAMGKTDFNAYRRLFYAFLNLLEVGFKLSSLTCYSDIVISKR